MVEFGGISCPHICVTLTAILLPNSPKFVCPKNQPQIFRTMRRTRSQSKGIVDPQPHHPTNPPTPKLQFRARKIPRLTSTSPTNIPEPSPTAKIPIPIPKPLTSAAEIDVALLHLRTADPLLAACISAFPPPQFPTHRSPFSSLVKSIISQQLSNKAAQSIENRFVALCGGPALVGPNTILSLSAQQLRQAGISGPKSTYLHDLSSKYRDGLLSDSSIVEMDDETLHSRLTAVKGIGPWSVHMFMIFTLHRPDVLPVGDLVVRRGVEKLYGLKGLPAPSQMENLCEKWKPYRSVGSWYMYRLMDAKGVLPTTVPTTPLL